MLNFIINNLTKYKYYLMLLTSLTGLSKGAYKYEPIGTPPSSSRCPRQIRFEATKRAYSILYTARERAHQGADQLRDGKYAQGGTAVGRAAGGCFCGAIALPFAVVCDALVGSCRIVACCCHPVTNCIGGCCEACFAGDDGTGLPKSPQTSDEESDRGQA